MSNLRGSLAPKLLSPGDRILTDDRPFSTCLRNRSGVIVSPYTGGNLPEFLIRFTDGASPSDQILHEKFLLRDDSPPSSEEYLDIIRRNFAKLRTTWTLKEREEARSIAAIAAEQLAEYIRHY